ncbi:MAG TPA: recombination mediator RecR [Cytophagaceae bacterium]|jgi:recombination protein RecR|nr:recombination mediator RecR [Cytophagaceae bacterium]
MNIPSKLIEDAVEEVSKLPGIGKKTALRLVLHLIKQDAKATYGLSDALKNLRENITHCTVCHNLSDHSVCSICENKHSRDHKTVCVVEDVRDVMAIENTMQYRGVYHVLGGVISPMNRIGPDQLTIESLLQRLSSGEIEEVILALSTTMEGDTTAFYLSKKIKTLGVKVTAIARGIPLGGELEYADEITLGRSIITRTLLEA